MRWRDATGETGRRPDAKRERAWCGDRPVAMSGQRRAGARRWKGSGRHPVAPADESGAWRDPVPVGELINAVLAKVARPDVAPIVRLRQDWDQVAGSWSTRCRPVALRGGVLTVVVVSGLEATRLRYEATALAERVGEALGGGMEPPRVAIRVATPAERAASESFDRELGEGS